MTRRARSSWLVAVVALAIGTGCAQVRTVGRDDDDAQPKRGSERSGSAAAPKRSAPADGAAPDGKPGQPAREGKPPLPATPSGLITDSAARQIKEQLHKRGYLEKPSPGPDLDARTSDALRRFQKEQQLAATGFPDQETLRRLDVSVDEAFEAAPEQTRGEKEN